MDRRAFLGACASALVLRAMPAAAQVLPRPLVARHPRLRALPWLDLGGLETPARPLEGFDAVWIKRDDLAGETYGGSKARKLELLLGEVMAQGGQHVVTFGAPASNHLLATAVHARRLGLRATLLVLPGPPGESARPHLFTAHHLGARLIAVTRDDVRDPEGARARHAIDRGAIFLPLGGSSPRGDVGYVNAGFELAAQVARGALPAPDTVVIAAGTGGAAAGLGVGLHAAGLTARLLAVRTSSTATLARIRREAEAVAGHLHDLDPSFPSTVPPIDHASFLGPGYARPSEAGERARSEALERAGLVLDSTYTAKAFAAVLARRARGRVLFVHTSDSRRVGAGSVTADDLPPALRAYAR